MVEVNFLCVHKKLRSKRMAPVLIKEITRRVHVNNIFQATFTAGLVLPSPIASCRYSSFYFYFFIFIIYLLFIIYYLLFYDFFEINFFFYSRYYHRSLNPKKLIETGFSHLGKNMTLARTIKLFKLPDVILNFFSKKEWKPKIKYHEINRKFQQKVFAQ